MWGGEGEVGEGAWRARDAGVVCAECVCVGGGGG